MGFAMTAVLNDTATAAEYRARYAPDAAYAAGAAPPSVVGCDVATSDVRISLSRAVQHNSSIQYCV